jgi:hypothetical protein
MTDAERAQKSRARRSDALERIEVTFWHILELSGALSSMLLHLKDHPDAVPPEVHAMLDKAVYAKEVISIALWDGAFYGRRKEAYIRRYGDVNFLSKDAIDRMKADHMERLEKIAARTGATFIQSGASGAFTPP